MATTSSTLAAGKAINGRGNSGKGNGHVGLKAKLAGGMAILGCAAALAFGGMRTTRAPIAPVAQPAGNPYWVYQEDAVINGSPAAVPYPAAPNQSWPAHTCDATDTPPFADPGCLPAPLSPTSDLGTAFDPYIFSGSLPRYVPALDWEQQERGQVAPYVAPVVTSERLRFLEINTHLPAQSAPASDWEQQERGEVAR